MRLDFSGGLPESVLEKVRRHSEGAEHLKSRTLLCHYCNHKAVIVFDNSRGHIQAKCKKCGNEAIYNVVLRRNAGIMFRLLKTRQ